MSHRYRRNSDSDIRDAERFFLSSGAFDDYVSYLVACQRASLTPMWCQCGDPSLRACPPCSTKNNVPVAHCLQCSTHICPGTFTLPDGQEIPCNQDLPAAPHCYICNKACCPQENCNANEILGECHQCGKTFCDDEECGGVCDECGVEICSECWFECEDHNNNHFCSDCTMDCEYCSNKCCPACVCVDEDCGISICSACESSDRAEVCNVCEERLCENHNLECSMCEQPVCKADSIRCHMRDPAIHSVVGRPCGAIICGNCAVERCNLCNKSGCSAHFEECVECEDQVCFSCHEECPNCSEIICSECQDDHQAQCSILEEPLPQIELPILPLSTTSVESVLQVGSRVQHVTTQLLGIIIKISEKDGIPRYVVEWDNDSAGKHSRQELVGPINLRRYYRC